MSSAPKFSVYHLSSNQAMGVCLHSTTEFNVGSCYNSANGRFSPTLAGYYSVSASCFKRMAVSITEVTKSVWLVLVALKIFLTLVCK
jgi:hypothetical protein